MKKMIIEVVGWYGILAILVAYSLANLNILQVDTVRYQLLNLSGGVAIMTVSYAKKLYQLVILNIIWSIIAIGALIRIVL